MLLYLRFWGKSWNMRIVKKLRWRLTKTLDLLLHSLRRDRTLVYLLEWRKKRRVRHWILDCVLFAWVSYQLSSITGLRTKPFFRFVLNWLMPCGIIYFFRERQPKGVGLPIKGRNIKHDSTDLSHDRISYGVQVHAALIRKVKKHVGGLHSLGT